MHVHSPEWISEHLCLALDGPSRSRWGTVWLTLAALRQQGLNAAAPPTTYLVPVGLRSSRSTKTRIRAPPVVRSWRHTTPLDPTIFRLRRVLQPYDTPAEICDFNLIYRNCIPSSHSLIGNRGNNGSAAVLSWPSIDSAESHLRQRLPATVKPPP